MSTRTKAPTIAEIAEHNARSGGHYFDRDTLRFFGQTRRDFRARMVGGRVIVYARTHRGWDLAPDYGVSSLAEYNPETGEVSTPADAGEIAAQL